jgi:hypothetical protein
MLTRQHSVVRTSSAGDGGSTVESARPPRVAERQSPLSGPGSRARGAAVIAVPVAIYVALSVLVFLPLSPWDTHSLPVCNCADYAKMTAFLEWTPWAILHGHNPFYTTYQDYLTGVNLATNTTMPFLGIVLAPVTLIWGPIASMNILSHVALAGSAAAAFLVIGAG